MENTEIDGEGRIGRRAQRRQEMRQRMTAAGLRVFAKVGFGACTVEDLLAEAGVSRATFYQHFSGKAELAQAILDGMWHDAGESYAAFARLERADLPAIRGWLELLDDQWASWSADLATILRELPFEISRNLGKRRAEVVSALIGDGRHWQAMSASEAKRRAALLIFQLEGAMQERHLHGWAEDRVAMLHSLASMWLKALSS